MKINFTLSLIALSMLVIACTDPPKSNPVAAATKIEKANMVLLREPAAILAVKYKLDETAVLGFLSEYQTARMYDPAALNKSKIMSQSAKYKIAPTIAASMIIDLNLLHADGRRAE